MYKANNANLPTIVQSAIDDYYEHASVRRWFFPHPAIQVLLAIPSQEEWTFENLVNKLIAKNVKIDQNRAHWPVICAAIGNLLKVPPPLIKIIAEMRIPLDKLDVVTICQALSVKIKAGRSLNPELTQSALADNYQKLNNILTLLHKFELLNLLDTDICLKIIDLGEELGLFSMYLNHILTISSEYNIKMLDQTVLRAMLHCQNLNAHFYAFSTTFAEHCENASGQSIRDGLILSFNHNDPYSFLTRYIECFKYKRNYRIVRNENINNKIRTHQHPTAAAFAVWQVTHTDRFNINPIRVLSDSHNNPIDLAEAYIFSLHNFSFFISRGIDPTSLLEYPHANAVAQAWYYLARYDSNLTLETILNHPNTPQLARAALALHNEFTSNSEHTLNQAQIIRMIIEATNPFVLVQAWLLCQGEGFAYDHFDKDTLYDPYLNSIVSVLESYGRWTEIKSLRPIVEIIPWQSMHSVSDFREHFPAIPLSLRGRNIILGKYHSRSRPAEPHDILSIKETVIIAMIYVNHFGSPHDNNDEHMIEPQPCKAIELLTAAASTAQALGETALETMINKLIYDVVIITHTVKVIPWESIQSIADFYVSSASMPLSLSTKEKILNQYDERNQDNLHDALSIKETVIVVMIYLDCFGSPHNNNDEHTIEPQPCKAIKLLTAAANAAQALSETSLETMINKLIYDVVIITYTVKVIPWESIQSIADFYVSSASMPLSLSTKEKILNQYDERNQDNLHNTLSIKETVIIAMIYVNHFGSPHDNNDEHMIEPQPREAIKLLTAAASAAQTLGETALTKTIRGFIYEINVSFDLPQNPAVADRSDFLTPEALIRVNATWGPFFSALKPAVDPSKTDEAALALPSCRPG